MQYAPMTLQGDNKGSIAMAKKPQFHQCSKHIDLKYHWIHSKVLKNTIKLESCQDPDQTVDVLTKVLL